MRRTKAEMEETISILITTARKMFSTLGYTNTSMDELAAQAGLTRGALCYHFGDKKGLLSAVVKQLDIEMDTRLKTISDTTEDIWEGFRNRCRAYLKMAQEPEIQRIVLRDARAILGNAPIEAQRNCIKSMQTILHELVRQNIVIQSDPEAIAVLIYGILAEASFWIAEDENENNRLNKSLDALDLILNGIKSR